MASCCVGSKKQTIMSKTKVYQPSVISEQNEAYLVFI